MSNPSIQKQLDKLYITNKNKYYEHLQIVKEMGHKVFRNSAGKHIVEADSDYIFKAFGGAFGKIFGGD